MKPGWTVRLLGFALAGAGTFLLYTELATGTSSLPKTGANLTTHHGWYYFNVIMHFAIVLAGLLMLARGNRAFPKRLRPRPR